MAKIIVADDEMLIRRLVCDFLIKDGHTPLEAADGKMAVELFNQNPDTALIIMDIMMPELDGWETTREIRRHSAVPIMLLSAQVSLTSVFGMGTGGTSPSSTPTDLTGSVYHNWSTLSSVS